MSSPPSQSTVNNVVPGHVKDQSGAPCEALHLAGVKQESNQGLRKPPLRSNAAEVNEPNSLPSLGRANAFAHLVQGWEAYINDPHGETFPIQLLCGAAQEGYYDRLIGPNVPLPEGHLLLAPSALRHTHSSPLKYGSSIFGQDGGKIPPPIPLDPFQRSSSTPSSFRQRSMNSAFTDRVPSQRVSYTSISKPDSRISAFDPVKYYARALEDMERTSIEVTDVSVGVEDNNNGVESTNARTGAATRAARFLTDVRVLRRRRLMRGGRDNPARPASNSSSSKETNESQEEEVRGFDTAVTVITEPNAHETSMLSQSSELSAMLKPDEENEEEPTQTCRSTVSVCGEGDGKDEARPESGPYHKLDSDVDEEEIHFRSIYPTTESPGTVPSPSYLPMVDERVPSSEKQSKTRIRIRLPEDKSISSCVASTPSPTRMNQEGSTTPRSSDSATVSPGTRSSGTGSSSGHTTQATFSTMNSGLQSGLSTISETDREVMEANTEGTRRRRGLDSLMTRKAEGHRPEGPEIGSLNSSSTSSSNPIGYLALANSPVSLREGANVPADRFFTNSPDLCAVSALRISPSMRPVVPLQRSSQSGSPGTEEASSATHTASSGSASEEIPPKFVSYLDRQGTSDLTHVREKDLEVSTKRGDTDRAEEREDSPAEFDKYPELIFADSDLSRGGSPIARSMSSKGRLDRYRSRPPKTPTKGHLPPTPPPRGSAVSPLNHPSPPRNIVDHPDTTITRPHVMRTIADGHQPVSVPEESTPVASLVSPPPEAPLDGIGDNVSPVNFRDDYFPSQRGSVKGRTYEDGSVEIFKTSSKEEMVGSNSPNLVTPDKNFVSGL